MLVGVAIGGLVMAGAIAFFLFGTRSFSSMANYADLNNRDRNATDVITRDIRSALQVVSATTNQIVLQEPPVGGNNNITYTYDPAAGTLTRIDSISSRVLLSGLNSFSFSLYQRANPTNNTYYNFPSASAGYAKLVSYSWSASRKLVGSQNETESVQTAMVYLRNR
jgi:hypothetical protein